MSIQPSGERVWIGRFAQSDRDAILVFDDPTFRVGAFDAASAGLQWRDVGTADEPLSTRMVWIGRFSRSDRSEMLTFDPVDKLWRLAKWDAAGTLEWSQAGRTGGFGDLLAGHRFWIGAFSRTGRDDIAFHYPDDVGYNNDGYTVLSAVIEVCTGSGYASWLRNKLFSDPRFHDLAPKVADPVRSARYYWFDGSAFRVGNHHPDYTDFTLAGGYYVSARALAEWVEALMSGAAVAGNRPILGQPELLFDRVGLNGYSIERFRGFDKNGAAAPGNGHTNARMAFLRGYGDERVFAFVEANAMVDASPLLDRGLAAIAEPLSRRPPLELPSLGGSRLRQTAFWSEAGALRSAIRSVDVDVAPLTVGDVTVERTRLLGPDQLPGGKSRNDVITVDLHGSLRSAAAGVHVFRLISDDGSFLWLNDALIADSGGDHGYRPCESDPVWLDGDGWYPIRVRFYNSIGGGNLWLEWRVPGASAFAAVPADHFRTDM